jgi:hypothetical protein
MGTIIGAKMIGVKLLGKFVYAPTELSGRTLDLDFLDSGSITFNSTRVSQIDDSSGSARHFSQSTDASRPEWTAGLGAVFNDDFLECASAITDSDGTFIFVARFDRVDTQERIFTCGNSAIADGDGFEFRKNSSANTNNIRTVYYVGTAPGTGFSTAITDTTTFRVYVFQRDAIYINNAEQNLVLYGSAPVARWFDDASTANRMMIGRNAGSAAAYGRFTAKRILNYDRKLTNAEIIGLVNYLKTYYGI